MIIWIKNNVNQQIYGLDFIIINILLFWMAKSLLDVNPNQEHLSKALDVKNAIIIPCF